MANSVFMIGNAHLDPVWMWRRPEGYSEVLATFRSALDRIQEFNDFIFTCAGAAYYQWVEETDSAMFEEIRQAVAAGKWVIVGGWWIQPDCNAPTGEAFARHSLYAQRYFKEKFGVTAKVGYNVDSFGHNAMIPQILKNSGMNAYVFMRPMPGEKDYPFPDSTFLWQSPDGSQVPTFRILGSYCTNQFDNIYEKAKEHINIAQESQKPMMCFYGVGNHGGGPTIENINALHTVMAEEKGDELLFSSPNAFFEEIDATTLPVMEDDLQHHASGCYTAVMAVKKANLSSTAKTVAAEVMNTIASGMQLVKKEKTNDIWKYIMFNQFHDILGGCCIKDALMDSVNEFMTAESMSNQILNRAQQAIAWNIDTTKGLQIHRNRTKRSISEQDNLGVPVVVFNPNGWEMNCPVQLNYRFVGMEDDKGNPVAVQNVRGPLTVETEEENRVATFVCNVPPMGWQLYWAYEKKQVSVNMEHSLEVSETRMENDWLRVDLADGQIVGILDKKTGKELLNAAVSANVVNEEHCDTWAHGIYYFDQIVGKFTFADTQIVENGSVCVKILLKGTYENSNMEILLAMYADLPGLQMKCRVDWREKHKMLKLSFATPFTHGIDTCGVPFGKYCRTANGKEQPMQKFAAITEKGYGLGIATDSRTAYDCSGGKLQITVLRSPIYADHYGIRDHRCEYTEQGVQEFSFEIHPVEGDFAKLYAASEMLLNPPEALMGTYHKGNVPACGSALKCNQPNIIVTAMKYGECSMEDIVVRCFEMNGRDTAAVFTSELLQKSWTANFKAYEIKTFLIHGDNVIETDFLEA